MIRLGLSEGNFCYSLYETLISNSFCVFKRLQKLQKCYDFLCTISISKYIQEISIFLGSNIIQRFFIARCFPRHPKHTLGKIQFLVSEQSHA